MNVFPVKALNVGKPAPYTYEGRQVHSGILKQAVHTPLYLDKLNFAGDGQGDLNNHGGADKAVNVYAFDHYPYWEEQLNLALVTGFFGENLTICGAVETEVNVGDTFALGEAIVQVTQPRQPCYKLAMRHGIPDLAAQVERTGFTGYYLRVLQAGRVSPADSLQVLKRDPAGLTIAFANHVMLDKAAASRANVQALLNVEALSASWRETLLRRLK